MENVAALRRYLSVPETLELMPAICAMNNMMGISGEGALPIQVAKLIAKTGMVVAPAAAPADEAAPARCGSGAYHSGFSGFNVKPFLVAYCGEAHFLITCTENSKLTFLMTRFLNARE